MSLRDGLLYQYLSTMLTQNTYVVFVFPRENDDTIVRGGGEGVREL